ncbi:MAG: hypothetical protein K8U57_32255 [Planctomycetes bacterium]|nr:hypothetical protein [Planctomycetota bacterium]
MRLPNDTDLSDRLLENKATPPIHATGRSAGRSDQSEGGISDADLAAIVAVWPTLPEPIKAAIRALVSTVATPWA